MKANAPVPSRPGRFPPSEHTMSRAFQFGEERKRRSESKKAGALAVERYIYSTLFQPFGSKWRAAAHAPIRLHFLFTRARRL